MRCIEFKITTWEKLSLSDENFDEVSQLIKEGKINSANDIYQHFGSDNELICEQIDNVDEQMTVEQNGGASTIEIKDDDGDVVWHNGKL